MLDFAQRDRLRNEIRGAQACLCPLCGKYLQNLPEKSWHPFAPTLDHVRSVANKWRRKAISESRRYDLLIRNALVVHRHCNIRKGDRKPYPCELIWLAAINAQVEWLWREIEES